MSLAKENMMAMSEMIDIYSTLPDGKDKLEEIIDPQSAFLGPNIWEQSCNEVNFSAVIDNLFNFNENKNGSKVPNQPISEAPSQVQPQEQPLKRKRGRKPGKGKLKKLKIKEIVVPGLEFDPKNSLCHETLKPQPIVRKSEKKFIPKEDKDLKYWKRRIRNNEAAKKSREARRAKENHIVMRAAYLEEECDSLRQELHTLQEENKILKEKLSKMSKKGC